MNWEQDARRRSAEARQVSFYKNEYNNALFHIKLIL